MAPLAFLDVGLSEMLVCGVVALLLFGGRLPEAMGRLGGAYRRLRRGLDELKRTVDAPVVPRAPAPYRPSASTPISSGVGEPPGPSEPARPAPAPAAAQGLAPPPATPPAPPVAPAERTRADDEAPPV